MTPALFDENVRAAELALHAVGRGDDRPAVGDVGLDGDRAASELVGQDLDTVGVAGKQRDPVAVTYAPEPGSRSEEALNLLGSWAATVDLAEPARTDQS